jgi:hypothetical protein
MYLRSVSDSWDEEDESLADGDAAEVSRSLECRLFQKTPASAMATHAVRAADSNRIGELTRLIV